MRLFFAYLNDNEPFNPAAHAVEQEVIYTVRVSARESEFVSARVEVAASDVGYINLGRRIAISCQPDGSTTVHPLVIGNITAIPRRIDGAYVELEVLGRMAGWEAAQEALVEDLASEPGAFDSLFTSPDRQRDASEVLSGASAFINWDRITGAPFLSPLDAGSRTLVFDRVDEASVSVDIEAPPLNEVAVVVSAAWKQDASVVSEVRFRHGSKLEVVADEALLDAWPQPGADLDGGWLVDASALQIGKPRFQDIGPISSRFDSAIYSGDVPVHPVIGRVSIRNARAQARTEVARVRVSADVQPVMQPGKEDVSVFLQRLVGEGDEVDPWQPEAAYSLGDIVFYMGALYSATVDHTAELFFQAGFWSRLEDFQGRIGQSFFDTERGKQALAYAVKRAVSRLRYRARAVRISFDVPLIDALDISLDDMATIHDPRFPGGSATGKVIGYDLSINDDGEPWATVEIGCSVGTGGSDQPSVPAIQGSPATLGPLLYPSSGRVSPDAKEQIALLRQDPSVQSVSVRVEIDAPAVPSTYELARAITLNCGKISLPSGVVIQ